MSFLRTALLVAIALLPCRLAAQETLHVPQDHGTIQEAVDAAADGDTIVIAGGTWEEAVVITGRSDLVVRAKGKVVLDPPGDAAALTLSGCTGVELVRLRVTGASDGFALVNCTGGGLFKCRVEDVSGDGIALDGCDGVLVEKCTIKDAGGDGIAVGSGQAAPSDDCIVLLNKVFDAGDEGIDVSGSFNSVDENLIVGTAGDGLRTESVPAASMNTFALNKVVLAGNHGIRLQGDDNELFVNKVIQAGANGIQLSDGSGHVVGLCKVVKPVADGLFGVDTALGVSVFLCKFRKPGANGADIGGDGAFVSGCKSAAAGDNGYAVLGDDGTWMGNRAAASGSDGFEVSGTGNTLTGNKAKGSKDGFDLNDLSGGANSIDDTNQFKTASP